MYRASSGHSFVTSSLWLNWSFSGFLSVTVSSFQNVFGIKAKSVLELLFVFTDVTGFSGNLSQRRDSSFFLRGEVCKFIHKLCFRCYTPDTSPLKNAWFVLLAFRTSEGKYMAGEEFLVRQKLTSRVSTASKQKSEGIHSGTGATPATNHSEDCRHGEN